MKKILVGVGLLLLVGGVVWLGWRLFGSPGGSKGPAKWSNEYYVNLLQNVQLPNLKALEVTPPITGLEEPDKHIRVLAEARGYRLQAVPTGQLVDLEQVNAQPALVGDWNELKAAAKNEVGITLTIVSGYRSVELQRQVFLTQFDKATKEGLGRSYRSQDITSGELDEVINKVLGEFSIPGYSRHHTGYSLDIEDTSSGASFEQFEQTKGFEWLSRNQYENARRFGFIPGYPVGATKLGPNAEPWEIVWVGKDNLR
ncbi:D-alanyl-D-alanine carboxypeptidase family protein [Candidatus Microgenomates bacterium]|nr:D-alanyl-D-alanine carboxypeptidase family protein [Candidatus Microgenomates bacterium]